jgi:hypothetical protein
MKVEEDVPLNQEPNEEDETNFEDAGDCIHRF